MESRGAALSSAAKAAADLRLAVEYRRADALVAYARNSRTHSDAQVRQIAASIREFGFVNPVLVDGSGGVIAGHGRLLAARQLGMEEVPVVALGHLTDTQRRALIIADNKIAENAGWDLSVLADEVAGLRYDGIEPLLLGFDSKDLDALLASRTRLTGDEDDVPDVPEVPVSRPGDLWILGHHRLLCGDSTSAEDVARLLSGAKPHLMVTDPPYGVNYDPTHRRALQSVNSKPAQGVVVNDHRADWTDAYALFPGDVAYVWSPGGGMQITFHHSLVAAGFEIRTTVIWAKSKFVVGRGHYHVQHEPCWYAVRKGATAHWQGARDQSTVWQINKPMKSETGHSTQKPVECMRRPIVNNSAEGDAVYDPFVGSGTTLIAGEMTGRHCYAMEIAPQYVDVVVRRWQSVTGGTATLDGDGRAFDIVAAARSDAGAADAS